MRRSMIIAVAALATSGSTIAHAGSSEFAMDTRLYFGYGNTAGTSMQESVQAEPRLDLRLSDNWQATVSARIRLDFANELEPGRAPVTTYSDISRPAVIDDLGTLELRDAYLERSWANTRLRIGKQQIVWGRLDGIKVLDVLNPQDFREFILEDFGDSRIGLWSAYLDATHGNWRFELAAIADNTGHAVPNSGAWFELSAPRYRYGADPGSPALPVTTDRGSLGVDSGALGGRLSYSFASTDVSFVAYSGLDHEPLGRVRTAVNGPVVERFYERREVYGLSVETASGPFAFRAELAHQPDRAFNTRDLAGLYTVDRDQQRAALGIDVDGPWDTFINVQYLYDHVRNAPDTLVRPSTDRITTVFLRRSFAYDALEFTVRWYYSGELGDRMLSFGLGYELSDNTELRLSADNFSGNAEGPFGQFADRDRVTVSLAHTF